MKKRILTLTLLTVLNLANVDLAASANNWLHDHNTEPQKETTPMLDGKAKTGEKGQEAKKLAKLTCNMVQSTQLVVVVTKETAARINGNIRSMLQVYDNRFETGIKELDKLNRSSHVVKTVWENTESGVGYLTLHIEGLDMEKAKVIAEAYLSLVGLVEEVGLSHERKVDCASSKKPIRK